MELHRLDGLAATGLDNLDIQDIDYEVVDNTIYEIGSLETLEGLGTVENKEITHEVLDKNGNLIMYVDEDENLYTFNGLEGFFKKIGRGLKKIGKFVKRAVIKPVGKAVKFVGKKILKPAFKFVNRFLNPVTILLRNGFLLAMKTNFMKVAEKLRFGYLTTAQAKKKGVNMASFLRLKGILGKARKIYELAGGKEKNLKRAILNGKGNRNKAVPLSGLDLGAIDLNDEEFADDFERFIIQSDVETVENFMAQEKQRAVEGLGEPVSGTAIAAASGAVAGIAGLLKTVTGVFEKANKTKDQVKQFIQPFNPKTPSVRSANPRATIKAVSRFQQNIPQGVVTRDPGPFITRRSTRRGFNPSITTTNIDNKPNESFLKQHGGKILIGVGILAIGGAVIYANRTKDNKTSNQSMNGIPKKKRNRDELGRFIGSGVSGKRKTTIRRKTTKKALPKKFTPKVLL